MLTSQLAHQAGAYPSFRSMKWRRVCLLLPDGMLVSGKCGSEHSKCVFPSIGTLRVQNSAIILYTQMACFDYHKIYTVYMLFAGREVRIGKNCARGLEYCTKTEGTVFPNTDRPRPANNVFIIFFCRILCKQFLCWIFAAAIFKPGVHVCLTFRKYCRKSKI